MASHSACPVRPASSAPSGSTPRGRGSVACSRSVRCAHGGSASSVACVAGRRSTKAYDSSRHVWSSSRNLRLPAPAPLAVAASRATANGEAIPALR